MKSIFSLLLCFLCIHGSAQIYFSDTTNKWDISLWSVGGGLCANCKTHYIYNGVVNQNGKDYRILSTTGGLSADSALIREDTVAKKVYAIVINDNWGNTGTAETVLYDYTLQKGDTFRTAHSGAMQYEHVVDSVGQVIVGGLTHKSFHFKAVSNPSPDDDYWVIEGIGSTTSPLFPHYPSSFERHENLYCFSSQGNTPLLTPAVGTSMYSYLTPTAMATSGAPYDNVNTCKLLSVSSTEKGQAAQIIKMPQPAFTDVKMKLPYVIRDGVLKVWNAVGQSLQQSVIIQQQELVIEYPGMAGIYYYSIVDKKSNRTFSGKVVFY